MSSSSFSRRRNARPGTTAARRSSGEWATSGGCKTLEVDVQWGRAKITPEQQERLRQFLASRGEITAGDRFVLKTLQSRARERQRVWLGLPLLILGAVAAGLLASRASRRAPAR